MVRIVSTITRSSSDKVEQGRQKKEVQRWGEALLVCCEETTFIIALESFLAQIDML